MKLTYSTGRNRNVIPRVYEREIMAAMAAKKKPSGVNIPEAQRTTVQVKLRLDVDVAEDLDALADSWGVNRSQAVTMMVERAMPKRSVEK